VISFEFVSLVSLCLSVMCVCARVRALSLSLSLLWHAAIGGFPLSQQCKLAAVRRTSLGIVLNDKCCHLWHEPKYSSAVSCARPAAHSHLPHLGSSPWCTWVI
jgi:hypothetical protein